MNSKLLLAVLALAAASGCQTSRYVTAKTWVGPNTLYVAYTEARGFGAWVTSFEAKVLRCNRSPDNRLACGEEQQLNTILNAGSATR